MGFFFSEFLRHSMYNSFSLQVVFFLGVNFTFFVLREKTYFYEITNEITKTRFVLVYTLTIGVVGVGCFQFIRWNPYTKDLYLY